MSDPVAEPTAAQRQWKTPPPLNPRLAEPDPIVLLGTALWGIASIVLLLVNLLTSSDVTAAVWTCLAGTGLGLLGYGVLRWQRAASRSGKRSAQTGL